MAKKEQDNKVVPLPYKDQLLQREIDMGEAGVFVIKEKSKKVSREGDAAYNKAWFKGLKDGLMTEQKNREIVQEVGLFDSHNKKYGRDIFEFMEELGEKVREHSRILSEVEEGSKEKEEISKELEEFTSKFQEISGIVNRVMPPSLEDYAEPAREAVIMSASVFQKVDGKILPVWKTPEEYLEGSDGMLKFVLRLQMSLLEAGLDNDEETITRVFSDSPELLPLLKGFQEQETATNE